jgi:uncharacterized RDD family membrane protein YckC
METITVKTSQHIDIDYPVAGLGERIAARAIDLGIFLVLYILLFLVVLAIASILPRNLILVVYLTMTAIFVFYSLLCEIFMNGQTIGKRIMKIKVISLDGSQATLGQYFIRWLFRLVDFWITGQVGGLLCIALTENKQRIGDIVAKTGVIKTVARTKMDDIAFRVQEDYTPVFLNTDILHEREVELIHEVLTAYYSTNNPELIYTTAAKIKKLLNVTVPKEMNDLVFLQTVWSDFNYHAAQE